MTVPLELVRLKRVALTDAALVQVLGEEYCLLTCLITATPSTSLSKSPMKVSAETARHGPGSMHRHVSPAAPTSAVKPLSHRTTTPAPAIISDTIDVDTDPYLMKIYRAGLWAVLGVLVAVLADRLAMAWYDGNNSR